MLNRELQNLLPDKNYHSSHDGVDQCKQQSGTQLRCLDPQSRPQFRPQFNMLQPGPYAMNQSTAQLLSQSPGLHSTPRFPPAPPASPPPTLPYPIPPRLASPPCSPTLPCPPTQVASPSTPSIPSSQPRHAGTPHLTSPGGLTTTDETRTYRFDLNPHWQEDKDHFDNQKINGLTFPRTIRQSAFSQKLDIEGCDPLKLPVAALLYQQANNFWLRKLAHGRELYLIPTGDIAAVVFTTELLTQLRNKGVDIDKVCSSKARQDGKLLDKTQNTKYAAQQVKARFEQMKMLRSNDGGLTMCYALRRLANNTQEPFRTLSLNAIDSTIKWWRGKPAPRASALCAPWPLSPNLPLQLKKFLRTWHHKMLEYQVPCHTPSFKTVFIKHAAVLDQLCNHKQAIADWSKSNPPTCCCKAWIQYKSAALNPNDGHWPFCHRL